MTLALALAGLFLSAFAGSAQTGPVVLLSIDGLKPDYVLEADRHDLRIPNLRRLLAESTYATAVSGVLPTVTYPSHATLLTGVSPAKHGIRGNRPFDPFGTNLDGWFWYTADIHAETLWDATRAAGLSTASVDWPVSVGAPVTFRIAQYWRAGNSEDVKLIRALSTPGLLEEAERALGPYPGGDDYGLEADRRRARFTLWILEEKKPRFVTAYFGGLDTEEHASGPYSPGTFETLEGLDELVGRLRAAAGVFCLVSDHGFARTEREVHVNAALHDAGLLELDPAGALLDWQAYAWPHGGLAVVHLARRDDRLRERVREVLSDLASSPASGVRRFFEREDDNDFVVGLEPGYRTGSELTGPILRSGPVEGTHGYLPETTEMDSVFFLAGPGIPPGVDLGRIDIADIAPTLARLLGVSLDGALGRDLLETHAQPDPAVHRR